RPASTRSRRRSWISSTTASGRHSISSASSTRCSAAGPGCQRNLEEVAHERGASRLTVALFLQYVLAAIVTTAEGTINLLYAPYLDTYGYALPSIGSLSALFAIFRLASLGFPPALAALAVLRLPPIAAPEHEVARGAGLRGLLAAHLKVDARVWLATVVVLYINVISDAIDSFFALFGLAVGLPLAAS